MLDSWNIAANPALCRFLNDLDDHVAWHGRSDF
jgi:hypothetical protein